MMTNAPEDPIWEAAAQLAGVGRSTAVVYLLAGLYAIRADSEERLSAISAQMLRELDGAETGPDLMPAASAMIGAFTDLVRRLSAGPRDQTPAP